MKPHTPRQGRWIPYGVLSLIFLILAVLSIAQALLKGMQPHQPEPITLAMLPALFRADGYRVIFHNTYAMFYLVCAVIAPLVLELTLRLPLRKEAWIRPLMVHLLVSTLFVVPWFFGKYAFQRISGTQKLENLRLITGTPTYFLDLLLTCAPVYFLVVLYGQALHHHNESRKHLLQASALERSLGEARLLALRMKLQPHFLFNTLNTLQFLALAQDTVGLTQVVDRLGRLLRRSMEGDGRPFVSLVEELATVDLYLGIEELRFKDRLRVVRHLEPEALRVAVPSLTLQPLVDNALKHGFGGRMEASLLELRAWVDGGRLHLTLRDDGPGPREGWDLATGCGRGLRHVLERLDLLYPGDHTFALIPAEGQGALVTLSLPAQAV